MFIGRSDEIDESLKIARKHPISQDHSDFVHRLLGAYDHTYVNNTLYFKTLKDSETQANLYAQIETEQGATFTNGPTHKCSFVQNHDGTNSTFKSIKCCFGGCSPRVAQSEFFEHEQRIFNIRVRMFSTHICASLCS